jgi:hypothetical protein
MLQLQQSWSSSAQLQQGASSEWQDREYNHRYIRVKSKATEFQPLIVKRDPENTHARETRRVSAQSVIIFNYHTNSYYNSIWRKHNKHSRPT